MAASANSGYLEKDKNNIFVSVPTTSTRWKSEFVPEVIRLLKRGEEPDPFQYQ